jgi:hypothetical protein
MLAMGESDQKYLSINSEAPYAVASILLPETGFNPVRRKVWKVRIVENIEFKFKYDIGLIFKYCLFYRL